MRCSYRKQHTYPGLALPSPFHTVRKQVEVSALPLSQERVSKLQHVAVHDAVLTQRIV